MSNNRQLKENRLAQQRNFIDNPSNQDKRERRDRPVGFINGLTTVRERRASPDALFPDILHILYYFGVNESASAADPGETGVPDAEETDDAR